MINPTIKSMSLNEALELLEDAIGTNNNASSSICPKCGSRDVKFISTNTESNPTNYFGDDTTGEEDRIEAKYVCNKCHCRYTDISVTLTAAKIDKRQFEFPSKEDLENIRPFMQDIYRDVAVYTLRKNGESDEDLLIRSFVASFSFKDLMDLQHYAQGVLDEFAEVDANPEYIYDHPYYASHEEEFPEYRDYLLNLIKQSNRYTTYTLSKAARGGF